MSFYADPESRKILVREARRGGVVTQESNTSNSQATHHQLCPSSAQLSIRSTGSTGSTEIRATGTLNGRGRCRRMIQFLSTETPALNPIILTYKIEVGEGGWKRQIRAIGRRGTVFKCVPPRLAPAWKLFWGCGESCADPFALK